jgi:glycosyltransferase involved in cell wall biosynthesis
MLPKASVWMITYNHENYIAQAIESVIHQVTTFDFELVIGEDCSTDATRKICLDFQEKYPNIIRVLEHTSNVGIHKNLINTLEDCSGEYIALLEGDDYWTDRSKLQKQVSFLSNHPEFVMCYQKTREINELTGSEKITNEHDNATTGMSELLERGWFMRTGSLVFRNGLIKNFPEWYYHHPSTDYMLHILLAQHGAIAFLNETTSVYRRHEGGITQVFQEKQVLFNQQKHELLETINRYLNYQYEKEIRTHQKEMKYSSFMITLRHCRGLSDVLLLTKLLPYVNLWKIVSRSVSFVSRRLKMRV